MPGSRCYTLTINYYTEEDMDKLMVLGDSLPENHIDYLLFGIEGDCCDRYHPHLHVMIHYTQPVTMMTVQKLFTKKHHIEIVKDKASMISYCKGYKDGQLKCCRENNWIEYGQEPHQGKLLIADIEAVMKNPASNFHLYNQYRKGYEDYKSKQHSRDKQRYFRVVDNEHKMVAIRAHLDSVCPAGAAYDSEDAVFVYCSEYSITPSNVHTDMPSEDLLQLWSSGVPIKYRYGYATRIYDPSYIYMVYRTAKELAIIKNKYGLYIDREWREDDLLERLVLDDADE